MAFNFLFIAHRFDLPYPQRGLFSLSHHRMYRLERRKEI